MVKRSYIENRIRSGFVPLVQSLLESKMTVEEANKIAGRKIYEQQGDKIRRISCGFEYPFVTSIQSDHSPVSKKEAEVQTSPTETPGSQRDTCTVLVGIPKERMTVNEFVQSVPCNILATQESASFFGKINGISFQATYRDLRLLVKADLTLGSAEGFLQELSGFLKEPFDWSVTQLAPFDLPISVTRSKLEARIKQHAIENSDTLTLYECPRITWRILWDDMALQPLGIHSLADLKKAWDLIGKYVIL